MSLQETIEQVRGGDVEAFTRLVKAYQNLAFACAFAILKDFHRAQDVTQEAFIVAYYQIARLQEPDAFPGWLKGIVRNQCLRMMRGKQGQWVPLDAASELVDETSPLDERLDQREKRDAVLEAVRALPDRQREVVSLFYIEERSQREVAEFLGIGVRDVNNRLHAARKTLKRSMEKMVDQSFQANALPQDFAEGIGKILRIQGSVIEAEFDPSFNTLLFDTFTAGSKGERKLSVVQRLNNGRVRCLLSGDLAGLKPNAALVPEPELALPNLEGDAIRQAIAGIGTSHQGKPEHLLTGIKMIDLLCPCRA